MEEERQEIEGATPAVLPNSRDHPTPFIGCSWPHTDRWEKPGKEYVILFGGKHSSSLAAGLLHKLIPDFHIAFCLSRTHSRMYS